jgi:exodeoxyribonuclease V alpha subunit
MKALPVSAFAQTFASFMGDRSGFDGSLKNELEELCTSLISSMQAGHTCLRLTAGQQQLLSRCSLVSTAAETPLVLSNNRLYLARYYHYEKRLAEKLTEVAAVSYSIDNIERLLNSSFSIPADRQDHQREAARVALTKGLCIISGGPGTGKTTTVVKIVSLLLAHFGPWLRIALTAPTGKAAMRLRESVASQIPFLTVDDTIKALLPREAQTLHRLLGVRKHSPTFRYNANRPLPWDVVIVDEASMVDLALMSKLVDGLAKGARLILLGDKDQLASVESGAVLSECIRVLSGNVVELQFAHRFNEEISRLAGHINNGDGDSTLGMIEDKKVTSVVKAEPGWPDFCGDKYERYLKKVKDFDSDEKLPALFQSLNSFRIICALKNGALGVIGINETIERILAARGYECGRAEWYPGRPVIVTRNDYNLGLFNGDIGICLPGSPGSRERFVWFEREDGAFRRYLPVRLPSHETAWALSVHKSQGSEFKEVVVVLPETDNQILSRELLYTAVTRAREKVMIRSGAPLCRQVVERLIDRQSGLADQLRFYNKATGKRE